MSKFYLTRSANIDLLDIEEFSLKKWGEDQTEKYINDLYQSFAHIAKKPELGKLRSERSSPFYMMPSKQLFVIYKVIELGIIIVTILHGRRNIENIVRNLIESLANEIKDIEDSI